ncbi:MAG: AmmeMemoRadiSam system radical SAM enzyme [Pseudomonadota bacterium]
MKAKIGAILFLLLVVSLSVFLIYGRARTTEHSRENLHPAMYYEKTGSGFVRCNLCPNRCNLSNGQIGTCRARINKNGELYSMVYGQIAAVHVDPIEKKPFFHVLPGSVAFSIATTGCNLRCKFCQNWQISQALPWEAQSIRMTPAEVVDAAVKSGAKSIAFTYSEPTVYYEYVMDIAKLAHEKGLKVVVVSAGYINPEPLRELLPYVDAYKIDFKGFSEKFYEKMTVGRLAPVLEAMKIIKEKGVWLEIVNLLLPGENDSEDDIKNLALWLKDNLGPDVPLHFSRFHPDYKMLNLPPTPVEKLVQARKIALGVGLNYVYIGNADYPEGEATYCPKSKEKVIDRRGFFVMSNNLNSGLCRDGEKIPGIWK